MACWLPLSNLFQRMLNFCAIARGAQIYYVRQPQEIMRHVVAIRPDVFIGVPRFYEKLHAGIVDQIEGMPAPRRRAALWGLRVGSRYRNDLRSGRGAGIALQLTHALADRLVLRRIRGAMGGNLRYMISGSAPMPRWLLERFEAIGWRVFEAYGLSENVIPVAANSPAAHRLGTVGRVMPGNEVRLAEDGELWVRGPGVCTGYLGDEAASPSTDADGYLATGDYATDRCGRIRHPDRSQVRPLQDFDRPEDRAGSGRGRAACHTLCRARGSSRRRPALRRGNPCRFGWAASRQRRGRRGVLVVG